MSKHRRNSPGATRDQNVQRCEALRSLAILDTAPEACFDTIVQLASSSLQSESAALIFIDDQRAWIKAWSGRSAPETGDHENFVRRIVEQDKALVCACANCEAGPREFAELDVQPESEATSRASAPCFVGVPVRLSGMHTLGALCVISPKLPDLLSATQLNLLEDLAMLISDQLELRCLRLQSRAPFFPNDKTMEASPFAVAGPGMEARAKWPQAADIRRGLDLQQFVMHYQPEVELATRRVVGLEALIRWQHPERGMIPPMDFIPEAEQNGMILPLGDWGLGEACRQMRTWLDRWPAMKSLRVCVNLSARQFAGPGLADHVLSLLSHHDLSPRQLGLELTESSLCSNQAEAAEVLTRLHRLGISLHMDDFGTGYSSLSHLHRFPFDVLKIDRSFIQRMQAGEQALQIVHTILELARVMGMDVVAEGIETEEQLRLLEEMGCRYGQGYLFSPPHAVSAIPEVLYELDPSLQCRESCDGSWRSTGSARNDSVRQQEMTCLHAGSTHASQPCMKRRR